MHLIVLIVGISAATVSGLAWALHKHKLGESSEKVSQFALSAALGLTLLEAGQEWQRWDHDLLLPRGGISVGGTYTPLPPPPPHPDLWEQARHIGAELVIDAARDLAISFAVFGLIFGGIWIIRQNRSVT